jgi:8-oxo-dGTP diphosphatase
MSQPLPPTRQAVDVAVGVLLRDDGHFLLTTRPPGKVYAGYWEFPGGKFEPGEDAAAALRRELHEEIGIEAVQVQPWRIKTFDYPHARVRLHFCKVLAWTGELVMHEGQAMSWADLPVSLHPVLPGTLPVLRWLADERGWAPDAATLATPDVAS